MVAYACAETAWTLLMRPSLGHNDKAHQTVGFVISKYVELERIPQLRLVTT